MAGRFVSRAAVPTALAASATGEWGYAEQRADVHYPEKSTRPDGQILLVARPSHV